MQCHERPFMLSVRGIEMSKNMDVHFISHQGNPSPECFLEHLSHAAEFDMSFVTWQILSSFKRCLIKPDHVALDLQHPIIYESLLILTSPSLHLRLKTSCTTWSRTWMSGARTWKRGSRCWRPNWKRCSATYRHFQASSVRWSASNTGTSWRCNSSPTTNTATTARSPSPGADRLPLRRPLPLRAARAASPAGVSGEDFRHHMAKLHFTVKPYGFNKVLSKFWWHIRGYRG